MLQKSYKTKTSDLIYQFVKSKFEKGFTAFELLEFLKENGLNVNKTTVYRNLDKLTEQGLLIRHKSSLHDGFIYQNTEEKENCHEHIHFQCSKCASVMHLTDKNTVAYIKSLSKTMGLEIDLDNSTLNGLCPKCKTNSKKK
ncbi:transcriptional repressor [Treponema pectinovorum]|uniref:Fur family transcriptional regulator n=1 Tax=Treponema pectinovorum TaxID=164 RepID=UPI003D905CE2